MVEFLLANKDVPVQPRWASLLWLIAVLGFLSQFHTGHITPVMIADATATHYAAHVAAYGYIWFVL